MKDRLVTPGYCFILAANFLLYFGLWLLIPVLPFYLSEVFSTSNSTIGIILSCYTVAALCIRPFSGYLLDSFARKPLYLLAYFIFMAMFAGYIIAGSLAAYTVTVMWGATLVARLLIAFVFPFKNPRKAMVGMSVLCTFFYVLLVRADTQGMAIVLLFAFAFSMAGLNPTAVASAGRMTSVTSMGIMLPAASSGAILMPWIIGIVAEKAGLAAGMASNIVPCVGLVVFTLLVARLPEE